MKKLRVTYSYDDVTLVPSYSDLKSRSVTNTSIKGYDLPVIMSPMDTVTTPEMIRLFVKNNLVATVHRMFKNPQEQFNWVIADNKYTDKEEFDNLIKKVYFSVGSVWKYKEWIDSLYSWGVKNFLVDMAHGDSLACVETIKYIKSLDSSLSVIAGNVASLEGFKRLQKAGADGVRVGIASGSICSTANETAFGVPILTNIMDIAPHKKNTWVIADGGVKYTGDIAKAVYFGADFVMCGRMLASTDLACGKLYNNKIQEIQSDPIFLDKLSEEEFEELKNLDQDYVKSKIVKYRGYKGLASRDARKNVMNYASVEGHAGCVKYTGSTEMFIRDTKLRLQASLSYAGAKNWKEFRKNAKAVMRSNAGIIAADTHLDVDFDR